ncbi:MAG: hypothetical protein RL072_70 [Actinomycetota bacterium]|jgi:dTDP-6-deoxy-L-talose 4-dehydrogenase (NAD+)
MRRILVTGATGFVGRHVIDALSRSDVDITAVVRDQSREHLRALSHVSRVVATDDIFAESKEWWIQHSTGVDTVLHTAWYTNPKDYMTSPKNEHCLRGTLRMADGIREAGVRRFVGIGTCLEYEQNGERLTTRTKVQPIGPYPTSKANAFRGLSERFALSSTEFAWCRLFYLYGPGENESRLVPYLRRQLSHGLEVRLSNPNQVLDFLEVQVVARQIADVVLGRRVGAINICSGVAMTVRELSLQVAREYGMEHLVKDSEDVSSVVSPAIVGEPSF